MEKLYKVAKVISSVLAGRRITRHQKGELEDWIQESAGNARLMEEISDESHIREDRRRMEMFDKEEGWRRVCGELGIDQKKEKTFRIGGGWRYAAAMLVVGIGFGTWVMFSGKTEPESKPEFAGVVTTERTEVKETKHVVLKLQNGAVVDLAKGGGAFVVDSGVVANNNGSLLSYDNVGGGTKELIYNEIYVPKGMDYQLRFSDGTVVYLNSMTKVRYPVAFADDQREVELEGEAFFEVAKDTKRPFIVKTRSMNVRVLGTKFNISCYENDNVSRATLVEGSVEVGSVDIPGTKVLKPNEQLAYDKGRVVANVTNVNVQYYTAWKDGWFRFRDVRMEELMKIMMRWYDMDVVYADPETKDYLFGCNIDRNSSVESLIRAFEQNGKVKIRQEGNKLILSKGR